MSRIWGVFGYELVSKNFIHWLLKYEHEFLGWASCPTLPYVPRFWPPFSLWQDRARSFWGIFLIHQQQTWKLSFGVQKLPIFTKIDLFGPKFMFFLDLFGSNFQRPAAHTPISFQAEYPPRATDISYKKIAIWGWQTPPGRPRSFLDQKGPKAES